MGFSVTAVHLIFAVAFLGAGGVAATAIWGTAADVDEDYRVHARIAEERAHTNITITSTSYAVQAFTINVENTGIVVLDVSDVTFVVDGAWVGGATVTSTLVEGLNTDVWLPGETLEVVLDPIATQPSAAVVVTGNGIPAYYRR